MWFGLPKWVPEIDGLYLCWHSDWSMEVVRYRKGAGFDTMGAGGSQPQFWTFLPKPPTDEILKSPHILQQPLPTGVTTAE